MCRFQDTPSSAQSSLFPVSPELQVNELSMKLKSWKPHVCVGVWVWGRSIHWLIKVEWVTGWNISASPHTLSFVIFKVVAGVLIIWPHPRVSLKWWGWGGGAVWRPTSPSCFWCLPSPPPLPFFSFPLVLLSSSSILFHARRPRLLLFNLLRSAVDSHRTNRLELLLLSHVGGVGSGRG